MKYNGYSIYPGALYRDGDNLCEVIETEEYYYTWSYRIIVHGFFSKAK